MEFKQKKLKLEIIKINGTILNSENMKELNIFESIVQPGITGYLSLNDFQGISEMGEIFAGDDIEIVFGSENRQTTVLKLKIYGSESGVVDSEQLSHRVKFLFCSPWLIDGLGRQISKPFKDKKISEIVSSLLTECKAKIGTIEETKTKLENFVSPLWTPLKTIKYLASFALNTSSKGGFVFWTDLKKDTVNFTTIDYLFGAGYGTAKQALMINPANLKYEGKVHQLNIENSYDIIRQIFTGGVGINNISLNPQINEFQETKKLINGDKQKHLSKYYPVNSEYMNKKYSNVQYTPLYPVKALEVTNSDLQLFIDGRQKYNYNMLFSDAIKINVMVNGESERKVGQTVTLNFPSQNESFQKSEHKHFKGDYLIRDIRHVISNGEYFQYMCLIADGYKDFRGILTQW